MRVLLAGGGSAGHIEPALALADAVRRIDPGAEVTCLGTERGLETRLIPLRGYPLELIPAVPMPRSVTPKLLTVPGRLASAVNAAAAAIDRTRAQVLVGFGGYVATPAYLAARRRKIPIVVHEANPKPGLANRLGARFTTHVFTGHPDTQLRNGKYLGIPIRREIADLDRLGLGDKARTHFGLRPDLPVLLVTGGSQGARSLNEAVFGAAGWLREAGVQVLHIIGPRNGHEAPVASSGVPYVAAPYIDRMDLAYAAADFALCRAGAMTCAELTAVGLPAAYVPLPIGNGEQRLNALPIVQRGGGMLVTDADLTAEWIRDTLLPVLVNIDQVADMSEAAHSLGRGDADRWLAEAVFEIVDGKGTVAVKNLITQAEPVPAARLGRVHFAGIGGAGMSGIARIMLARGIGVSGSDARDSALLGELRELGASVHVGHAAGNLGHLGPGDTLVVSSAIRPDNPELAEAARRGMRVVHRAAALASVMAGRRVIAVAGTHGKTTTTSMLTTVLRECGADPGYVIGGILTETGLGAEDGSGLDFVAEADESDGSFLLLSPDLAIITNVEADHLDNYASLADIQAAFTTFGLRVSGMVLTCADDPGAEAVAARLDPARVRRYGESRHADYRLTDVASRGMAISFTVAADRGPFGEIFTQMTVDVPGHHNALNATAAFAAAIELGFAPPRVAAAIAGYRGARRRMELKGEARGVRVLDSYAHHPTELAADLRAARSITQHAGKGRVIAIFQPHLFSRTRIFAAEFGAALGLADEAIVLDVYAAREDPEPGVTGQLIVDAVPGGHARFVPDPARVAALIDAIAEPGDLVLTMGAGDITALGPRLVEILRGSRE